ncbi:MAG: hypothetical protein LUH22_20535 [Bacteroides sp.]|nr:hypothetical protein [Bacteroides sp.]
MKKGGNGMEPFGSGVFVLIHGEHFILTASHVAEVLEGDEELYVQVDHNRYIKIFGDINMTDMEKSKGVDLAYIKLAEELISPLQKPYIFLTIDKFRKHHNLLDASNYCVLGFPENNVKRENGQLKTGAAYYVTTPAKDNRYEYYNFSKEDCFILDMEGKGTNLFTGERSKVNTHFHGISGCGLWYLIVEQDPDTKEYFFDYRLIGIMTEYRRGKYFCLIGNRIYLIIEAWKVIEGYKFREIPITI